MKMLMWSVYESDGTLLLITSDATEAQEHCEQDKGDYLEKSWWIKAEGLVEAPAPGLFPWGLDPEVESGMKPPPGDRPASVGFFQQQKRTWDWRK